MPNGQQFIILPSEKAAEYKRRVLFARSKERVWLGENIFSLPHFLKTISTTQKPLLKRNTQKHLVFHCLKNFPLKYFDKLRQCPSLAGPFLSAIRQLKRHALSPSDLRERLEKTGTPKENDLLATYERYEELKAKLGVMDEEDQYSLAIQNFHRPDSALKNIQKISFENFSEKPTALHKLVTALAKTHPKLKVDFEMIAPVDSADLKNISLLSFSSPYQESRWFLRELTDLNQTAILISPNSRYYESIWQKMKNAGLLEGPSPFPCWRERPEGRHLLNTATHLPGSPKTLTQWIETLLSKINKRNPLYEWIGSFYFPEHCLSLGPLSHAEWLAWFEETLEERPVLKIPDTFEGVQWLDLADGDYPAMEFLWVPGLVEGQFPAITPLTFFQDPKDRSTPEWRPMVDAFPNPQTQFEKQRKEFFYQLSKIEKTVWLTYPRWSSLGKDFFASPLTWHFKEAQTTKTVPLFFVGAEDAKTQIKSLQQKFVIEQERWSDSLKTSAFHANFKNEKTMAPLDVQMESHIFSPSRLERYAECPFKYFANRVLRIPEVREFSPEVDPQDRGDLFHQCLEKLLTQHGLLFKRARTSAEDERELYQKLEEIVENIFQEMRAKIAYANTELYQHLKQKTLSQATQVLQTELAEAKELENPLDPTYFEWAFGNGALPPLNIAPKNANPMLLGGRIDRIDTNAEEKRFIVLDYKTGPTSEFQKKRMEGLSLQLPVYILAVKKLLLTDYQPVGGMLISVREAKKLHGMVDTAFNKTHYRLRKNSPAIMETSDFEKAIEATMDQIQNYVLKIREGYFSASPKDCKPYCDYKEICRYAHKPMD